MWVKTNRKKDKKLLQLRRPMVSFYNLDITYTYKYKDLNYFAENPSPLIYVYLFIF